MHSVQVIEKVMRTKFEDLDHPASKMTISSRDRKLRSLRKSIEVLYSKKTPTVIVPYSVAYWEYFKRNSYVYLQWRIFLLIDIHIRDGNKDNKKLCIRLWSDIDAKVFFFPLKMVQNGVSICILWTVPLRTLNKICTKLYGTSPT